MEIQLATPHLIGYSEEGGINSLALSSGSERVIVADCSPSVRVWDTLPRLPIREDFAEVLRAFQEEQAPLSLPLERSSDWWRSVNFVAFSTREEIAYLGFAGGDVEIWDVTSPQLLGSYYEEGFVYDGELDALALSPDERRVIVAGDCPGQIIAWDRVTDVAVWQAETYKWTYALALSPDSQEVAAATWDGMIYLWDAQDGSSLVREPSWMTKAYPYRNTCFFALQFSPTGKALAVAGVDADESLGCIHLFDLSTQTYRGELVGHSGGVHALAFSPDGRWLASGGRDGILRLWNAESGQQVVALDLGTLGLPRQDKQKRRVIFARRFYMDNKFPPGAIHALAFAHDGEFLAVGTESGAVIRLDVT